MLHRCLQLLFMLLVLAAEVVVLRAQTQIDLRSQSRNVDFSQASSVRPFKTGTTLPATCTAGEMFFKTSAASGANTYGCVATNTWAVQGSGGGGGAQATGTNDFLADVNTGANTLTITCPAGSCNVQAGDTVAQYTALQAVFAPKTGTYTAVIYLEGQGLHYGYPSGLSMNTCTATCVPGVTQFPSNVVPLYTVVVSGGVLQSSSLRDYRTHFRMPKKIIQGPNLVIAETASSVTWSGPSTLRNQPSGSKPSCTSATRGTMWHTNGSAGVKDTVELCAKDAAENYAWRAIY